MSLRYNFKKMISEGKNKGILGYHRIIISEEGLTEITEVGESKINWDGIEKIINSEHYIFLYIGSCMAHVVPKRNFNNLDEANDFYNFALKCKENYL